MSGFISGVSRLGGGSLIAQAISLAAMPLITRLYDTNAFGIFAIYAALTSVLFPISNLRLNAAMLLPASERQAAGLFLAACSSTFIFALLVAALIVLIMTLPMSLNMSGEAWLLWLIPVGVLVQGQLQNLQFWVLRRKLFSTMAVGAVTEAIGDRGTAIGLALAGAGPVGLILGRIVGPALNFFVLARRSLVTGMLPQLGQTSPLLMRRLVCRYRQFPIYSSWAFLFANGAREAPTLLLGLLQPTGIVGAYALGVRVLNWPMLLIGDAIAKVFLQKMASERDKSIDQGMVAVQVLRYSSYLMLPPTIILILFGDDLFRIVFGDTWTHAGVFTQILATSFFSAFIYRILSAFFDVYERQQQRLIFDIALFTARCLGLLAGNWLGGIYGALWGLLATTLLVHLAGMLYLLSLVNLRLAAIARLAASILTMMTPTIAFVLGADLLAGSTSEAIAWLATGLVAQVIIWYWLDEGVRDAFRSLSSGEA